MINPLDELKRIVTGIPHPNETECFWMGYDSEIHGANEINCHFSLFSTPEKTKAWSAGIKFARDKKGRKND